MKKVLLISFLFVFLSDLYSQQYGRIESEYKLSVPKSQKEEVWEFLQSKFLQSETIISGKELIGNKSSEKFIDQYFDTPDKILSKNKTGIRFRKRYIEDALVKELIQLKLPQDSSGLSRTEIKFEPKKNKSVDDLWARHPFLKHIRRSDRESINFHISHLLIKVEQLQPAISLVQLRDRIYLSDTLGSIATITLDKVNNMSFPFQGFVEMEIELNEIRYTEANSDEKNAMDKIREELKSIINNAFQDMNVDQTPKYNKMETLVEKNILGKIYQNAMWIIFAGIILFALYLRISE